mgnify:CR=1 FL=1|jgi:hypothetical protein
MVGEVGELGGGEVERGCVVVALGAPEMKVGEAFGGAREGSAA